MKQFTLILTGSLLSGISAYTGGSITSSFGGSVLLTGSSTVTNRNGATIDMKKGKDNVPPAMRAQYKKQKELQGMREQMQESQQPGADGLPVFNLFVRSPRANVSFITAFLPATLITQFIILFKLPNLIIDVVSMWVIQGR